MADKNNFLVAPHLFKRSCHTFWCTANVVDTNQVGMLLQQQSGLTIIALRIVVPFSHPHHPVCPVFLLHQLQETGLSIAMRPIAETAGNQTKRSGLPCTQAA